MGTQFDQGKLNSALWEWKPWIKWTYCRHTQNTFPSDTLFASCTSIVDVLSKPDFSSRIDIARYVGTKINPHYTCQLTSHRRFPPMTNIRKWGADLRICATRHFCGYFFYLPALECFHVLLDGRPRRGSETACMSSSKLCKGFSKSRPGWRLPTMVK